jgi:hypothetical protein
MTKEIRASLRIFVMRGLDPRIHLLSKINGLAE